MRNAFWTLSCLAMVALSVHTALSAAVPSSGPVRAVVPPTSTPRPDSLTLTASPATYTGKCYEYESLGFALHGKIVIHHHIVGDVQNVLLGVYEDHNLTYEAPLGAWRARYGNKIVSWTKGPPVTITFLAEGSAPSHTQTNVAQLMVKYYGSPGYLFSNDAHYKVNCTKYVL